MADTAFLARLRRAYAALGKAIPDGPIARHRPDLARREHLTGGYVDDGGGGMAVDHYIEHATIYQTYVWVRKAVNVITTAAAPLPRRVVALDGTPVPNHPLTALLARPNAQMDGAEWVEICLVDKLLGGEWFSELVTDQRGRPAELWPRRPDEVWIEADPAYPGYPIPLAYHIPALNPPTIPAALMIHEMFHNPLNPWRGISVIGAAREEIAVDLLTLQNTQRTLKDGTREYAITLADMLTQPERDRIDAQLYARYGRHRPMVLEAGQGVAAIGTAPDDLEWLQARDYSREAVGALFGVFDEIMGFGKDTYENFENAYRVFWQLTLLPLTQRMDATLSHFFRQHGLLPTERIATDLSGVAVLQEAVGPKIEAASKLWSMGVPYNVAEAQLGLGTGPVPGGDVGYLPANLIPVSMAGQEPPPIADVRTLAAVSLKAASTTRDERALRQALQTYLAEQYEIAARAAEGE